MVPFGDVVRQGLESEGVINHGSHEARFALGLGLTVGGMVTFLGGFTGEVFGGALSVTGIGATIGVPAVVVSGVAVVGGAANLQSGWALMVGEGMGGGGSGASSGGATPEEPGGLKWGNPTSRPTYGHTFDTHGAGVKNSNALLGRARGPNGGPQGQWLDNKAAAKWLGAQRPGITKPTTVPLPAGMGQVIRPDGSIVPARNAMLIPAQTGGYKTAFPVE